MTATLTLATWLEEQLAADEAVAIWIHDVGCVSADDNRARQCDCGAPAHVLAQIAAVREVLALHALHEFDVMIADHEERHAVVCDACMDEGYPCATVRALAKPYAARPGYAEVAG